MLLFMCIGAVGFVFLVFTLMFGGEHGHDVGHDIGHDVGHDGHEGDGGAGPSVFSPLAIAFFLTGFGGAGMVATVYGLGIGWSTLIAVVAGASLYGICFLILSLLYKQQSDSTVTPSGMVNKKGIVTLAVDKDGVGKASFTGVSEELVVREVDGVALPTKTQVVFVGSAGGGVYLVRKLT